VVVFDGQCPNNAAERNVRCELLFEPFLTLPGCQEMRSVRRVHKRWQLCLGYILIIVGIGLIDFSETQTLKSWVQVGICATGVLAPISGLFLIWKARSESALSARGVLAKSEGNFLGRFRLNRYTFEAYEQNGLYGNQELHLVSSPRISSEKEAACIRYLVNEGLIEELWPQMSRQIIEETDWAFLV
jgi:hypothetical protein